MAAEGCFLLSGDAGDVRFSDYREAFGDPDDAAEAAGRKIAARENEVLGPLRELRGIEVDDGTG